MKNNYEISLLVIRLVLGVTFVLHGIAKFEMGLTNVAGWFESIGLFGSLAYVVAFIELFGGIALILGLGTRVAAFITGSVMVGAIVTAKLSAGFLGGYELDIALLAMAIALVVSGSRMFAMESKLFSENEKITPVSNH
ncbi:oxidoreductase [Lottiidibacillus patelloidae]|uniref:Oxidoreductase n=1 Tax=Lottiidibacillus patelloidae TaxID=2670334 RepID=A0A263BQC5_9BACI|nr:DoxX family protein [Lottiidibacillus patelloidae]OZM55939.1 oxidoreductase [Lottiidibacillus patelloidae]